MSATVLPQLLEVNSELTAQATALEAQLSALQEKRQGIQTVISMFESGLEPQVEDIAKIAKKATKATSAKKKTKSSASKTSATKSSATKSSATKTSAKAKTTKAKSATKLKATRGRPVKAKTKASVSKAASKTSAGKAPTGKRSGRTANWQRYVQDSYSKAPLPDVIVGVLQAQPNNIFKIADVMSAVFKEDMPKNHFLKARNRVSNILSAGARDGEWYRGRNGTYSASEKAIKSVG